MNGHASSPMDYKSCLEGFRRSDSERDAFVAELLQNFQALELKYTEKCDDYNNEVESRRMWQSKAKTSEVALIEQKQASGSNNFALAVIDGDGAVFQDYLLAQGKDGGADCAHYLHTELRKHLKATYPDSNGADWSIVVHIVLNMQGLGNKLQQCNIINNPNELVAFGRAFSLAQPLFSFIDVGGGKERADHKIREMLRLFLPNAQCKHVFFGPCHDNGYLPVLEPYRLDQATAARLTLIECSPATPGFQQVGLQRIRCPKVFRMENLPAKVNGTTPSTYQATNGVTPPYQNALPVRTTTGMNASTATFVPTAPVKHSSSSSPAPSAESGASNTWAAVGKTGPTTKTIDITSKKAPAKKHVLVNTYDERLDAPLPESDSKAFARFADRIKIHGKMCNNYHLTGKCEAGEYCDYHHGERLTPGEQLVLKHKARSLCCPQKTTCRDAGCSLGHHCKHGSGCYLEWCRFAETHGRDLEPAKKVFADGSEEWLSSYLERYRTRQ
ncbi:hypothetical protein LTR54_001140 [Friedmanniomyces endolithicus]|nr:hypothetical protein LTS00_015330 [Friedmanniomyces endolithicus]KAK1019325.1 hypothetical protein LTR54_001140 [Friedmanniomyces endolithicus]